MRQTDWHQLYRDERKERLRIEREHDALLSLARSLASSNPWLSTPPNYECRYCGYLLSEEEWEMDYRAHKPDCLWEVSQRWGK